MAPTRITVVMDIDHEPDLELPRRAAQFLEETLSEVDGVGNIQVIEGEVEKVVWRPHRALRAS